MASRARVRSVWSTRCERTPPLLIDTTAASRPQSRAELAAVSAGGARARSTADRCVARSHLSVGADLRGVARNVDASARPATVQTGEPVRRVDSLPSAAAALRRAPQLSRSTHCVNGRARALRRRRWARHADRHAAPAELVAQRINLLLHSRALAQRRGEFRLDLRANHRAVAPQPRQLRDGVFARRLVLPHFLARAYRHRAERFHSLLSCAAVRAAAARLRRLRLPRARVAPRSACLASARARWGEGGRRA